ncbi:MAG: hypothetical protein ACK4L8_06655 [Nitrincola lacisaponensis]|uniref:hypothetical protein n=1 Tax=Nitrincola lacisaponensis TaxID=267850 RepID=UPI00391B7536
MKPFSTLLIKLLGLYLGLNPLLAVTPLLFSANVNELWTDEWRPVFIATLAIPMIAGLLLWYFASAIASRLHDDTATTPAIHDDDLVRAGSFLIGMYLFIQHLGLVINRYTTTGELSYGSLLVVILSILILLGQNGLLRIYRWVKYLGLRKQSVDHH